MDSLIQNQSSMSLVMAVSFVANQYGTNLVRMGVSFQVSL